jgi:hypothetical protein
MDVIARAIRLQKSPASSPYWSRDVVQKLAACVLLAGLIAIKRHSDVNDP